MSVPKSSFDCQGEEDIQDVHLRSLFEASASGDLWALRRFVERALNCSDAHYNDLPLTLGASE